MIKDKNGKIIKIGDIVTDWSLVGDIPLPHHIYKGKVGLINNKLYIISHNCTCQECEEKYPLTKLDISKIEVINR